MPHIFDKLGVRFLYPDNWLLDEGESASGEGAITVYSPEGSFWSLVLDPPTVDPTEMAAAALAAIKTEYENCDAEPVREELAGQEIRGYDANFFYLDLTSTVVIRGFRSERASCLVVYQAEDRDFAKQEEVFRAMTVSLLQNEEERRQGSAS